MRHSMVEYHFVGLCIMLTMYNANGNRISHITPFIVQHSTGEQSIVNCKRLVQYTMQYTVQNVAQYIVYYRAQYMTQYVLWCSLELIVQSLVSHIVHPIVTSMVYIQPDIQPAIQSVVQSYGRQYSLQYWSVVQSRADSIVYSRFQFGFVYSRKYIDGTQYHTFVCICKIFSNCGIGDNNIS